jgi:hypothetical protein
MHSVYGLRSNWTILGISDLGFVQMQLDLEERLKKPVDLVSSQAVSKRIQPYINQDKMLIYDSTVLLNLLIGRKYFFSLITGLF